MLMAVGFVALAAARLDEVLRELFCGLEGTKYAAVTAGGQGTQWLVDACVALAKQRNDVSAEHGTALSKLFLSIKDPMKKRNSYIHSIWQFDEPGREAYFAQSRRHYYSETPHWATLEKVIETGRALAEARKNVTAWMNMAGIEGEHLAGAMKLEAFWNQPSEDDGD